MLAVSNGKMFNQAANTSGVPTISGTENTVIDKKTIVEPLTTPITVERAGNKAR